MSERFLDKIFQAFEDVAVQQEQSAPIVPSDGDDMTWSEDTLSKDTAMASESSLAKVWGDDMTWEEVYKSIPPKSSSRVMLNVVDKGRAFPLTVVDVDDIAHSEDHVLSYPALVRTVYRLQNEVAGLAAQVVEANAQVVETQRSILRMIEIQERHATNTLGTAQNLQSLAAQVVELRERVQAWEADS